LGRNEIIAKCNSVASRRRGGKVLGWGGVVANGELMVATTGHYTVIGKVKMKMERQGNI
jgi:hypothetical protein